METQKRACHICGNSDARKALAGIGRKDWLRISCPNCGEYVISQVAFEDFEGYRKRDPLIPRKLARFLYEQQGKSEVLILQQEPPSRDIDGWTGMIIGLDGISKLYQDAKSPLELYQETILNLASRGQTFGHTFSSITDRWAIPTMDDEEAEAIVNTLFETRSVAGSRATGGDEFRLTLSGLGQAAELRRDKKATGKVVFVAACFIDELAAARSAICSTVDELGYTSRIVNLLPHNDLIDLKIYELIRESRFIVADLTWHRQSVYYEVGFAHGLGLEVILTCRSDHQKHPEDDFKRVHFDLGHRNILFWDDEQALGNKLRSHILQSFGRLE